MGILMKFDKFIWDFKNVTKLQGRMKQDLSNSKGVLHTEYLAL